MQNPENPSRSRCERCRRPLSHCLCSHIPTVLNRTRVLVLQHPDEAKHPLNTARLAVLGLQNAELRVGEHFPELEGIVASATRSALLFPGNDAQPPAPVAESGHRVDSLLLIVPDGTWRKARKIIHANPALGGLPRFSLPVGAPSAYRVRKAREPAAVSTLEAIVRTLSILEPEQDFQPLLKPFEIMVEQQIQAMGEDVYRRHHA